MRTAALPLLAALGIGQVAGAQLTGKPVPELAAFDDALSDYMQENRLDEAVLGVMKDDVIVYQRGWGDWENTPMRLASVSKPLTAGAIRVLVSWGWLQLSDFAFSLNGNGGILPYIPWPQQKDPRLDGITIQHLISHMGGWDRDIAGDPQFLSVEIAQAMGLPAPANRVLTVQFMLGQTLQYDPGTTYAYSNFGYMVLGMIVEQLSGMSHADFITNYVLTAQDWIPSTELFRGETLQANQHFREPVTYNGPSGCTNVYNPGGPTVACPYGGFPIENFVGHGSLVSSAAPLLEFLSRFTIWGPTSGLPHGGSPSNLSHTGGMWGTSTIAAQRNDNVYVVVLMNSSDPSSGSHAQNLANQVYALVDMGVTWPRESVDGFWVDFGSGSTAIGSYDNCFTDVDNALSWTEDGTKLRFKPGSSGSWSGVITQRVLMDAPEGTAVIGE